MNVFKRAILYIARKWKKTLLIFFILFATSALVLSGLAIRDAQEEQTAELKGTTGVSFSVARNTATGGSSRGNGGSYSTQEFLSEKMIQSIAKVDGIKGYNASIKTILHLSDTKDKYLERLNPVGYADVDCQFYSFGCYNSEYDALFLSGALSMCDGDAIDAKTKNGVVISKDIANKHGLKVGDTIKAVNDPYSNDTTGELKIVGLFDITADKTDEKNNYSEASYFDYTSYAFVSEDAMKELLKNYTDIGYSSADFFVADPESLETIIQKVQSISSINWNNFIVSANNEVYERVAGSISNISLLISVLIVLIVIVSLVIIVLILSMWIRSRKKEIGVLLSIGSSKAVILLQYTIEMLLIGVIAFPSAYILSQSLAGNLAVIFGKSASNIVVTSEHFIMVGVSGCVLLVLSVACSCIPVMRYQPKQILSQME